MVRAIAIGLLAGLLATAGAPSGASAQTPGGAPQPMRAPDRVVRTDPSPQFISPGQAAAAAKQRFGGRVLSTRLRGRGSGNPHYVVRLLKDGNVRHVRVHAVTGSVE